MSRLGKNPVTVPSSVTVEINGKNIKAKGPMGELTMEVHKEINAKLEDNKVIVSPATDSRVAKAMWATTRTLVNNIVIGVNEGYKKELEIRGVGYRAQMKGTNVQLQLGFSHEVIYNVPAGISVTVVKNVNISITGIDKQKVGQVAAEIISFRPPEPYKGKGIRHKGEEIILKEGKKK